MYSTGSRLVCEWEEFYLAGCENFTVKEIKCLKKSMFSERKHGEREIFITNSPTILKISCSEENMFFPFFRVDFNAWIVSLIECGFDISLNHKLFISCFFLFIMLPVASVGCVCQVIPVFSKVCLKEVQRVLCFHMMSKIKNKDNIHT